MTRVLIVDDDHEFLAGLLRRLRRRSEGLHIVTASSGREALRLAQEEPVAVLVTDILMPEMDGIETVLAFRRGFPETRIVAMSGGGTRIGKEPLAYAERLGADLTLQKPFEAEDLVRAIRELVEPE